MVSDHGARAEPIRPGREVRAETKFELPKLRGGPCSAADRHTVGRHVAESVADLVAASEARLDGAGATMGRVPNPSACPPAIPAARPACWVAGPSRGICWCGAQVAAVGARVLPAQLPGRAVGTDRREAAGSGRPACPAAIPAARPACLVAGPSRGIFWCGAQVAALSE